MNSIFGALFVAFTVLKLTGYVTWSWWWVTAPLWGGFILIWLILVVSSVVAQASRK